MFGIGRKLKEILKALDSLFVVLGNVQSQLDYLCKELGTPTTTNSPVFGFPAVEPAIIPYSVQPIEEILKAYLELLPQYIASLEK